MGKPNTTNSEQKEKQVRKETLRTRVVLRFGIFFDGTNNQEVQVMIGKRYYRKHTLEKLQQDIDSGILSQSQIDAMVQRGVVRQINTTPKGSSYGAGAVVSIPTKAQYKVIIDESELLSIERSFWQNTNGNSKGRGILLESDLDNIYFGYETLTKRISTSMEDHIQEKAKEDKFIYSDYDNKLLGSQKEAQSEYIQKTASTFKGNKINDLEELEFDVKDNNDGFLSLNHPQDSTYTNIAILDSIFASNKSTATVKYIPLYVEGSGTNAVLDENIWSRGVKDTVIGQGLGIGEQGVLGKLKKICNDVRRQISSYSNNDIYIYFYVFGFSRGATTARIFNYVATCEFDDKHKLKESDEKTKSNLKELIGSKSFLGTFKDNIKSGYVKFLGIYDTVGSIGLNVGIKEHPKNVGKYHLYETDKAEFTFHICAIDEVRENFALVDIQSSITAGKGLEVLLPGCHTDIGGGASLGMSGKKNIPYKVRLWKDGIHSSSTLQLSPLIMNNQDTLQTLFNLGWLNNKQNPQNITPYNKNYVPDTTYGFFDKDKVSLCRRVSPGYSNVTLTLMRNFPNCINLFNNIPLNYAVPKPLYKYYKQLLSKATGIGRLFIYPKFVDYGLLRRDYINYSASDDWINGGEEAEFNKMLVLSRLIYSGVANSTQQHMFDFNSKREFVQYSVDY